MRWDGAGRWAVPSQCTSASWQGLSGMTAQRIINASTTHHHLD